MLFCRVPSLDGESPRLCPTYAVKWKEYDPAAQIPSNSVRVFENLCQELQGMDANGNSNWSFWLVVPSGENVLDAWKGT